MARKHIGWKTKYAAALLKLGDVEYLHAKQMSEDQIISLYHVHHNIHHADGGVDEYWNVEPMLIAPHKERTAKIDVPTIAKNKRIRKKRETHLQALNLTTMPSPSYNDGDKITVTSEDGKTTASITVALPRKKKWLSRPFQKRAKRNAKRSNARSK